MRRPKLPVSRCLLVVALLVTGAAWPAGAPADVAGTDESPAQPYGPLQLGRSYSGAFASGDDVDYLSFTVAEPETVQIAVQNTTGTCNDPNAAGCPVYATLMDPSGTTQVGGDGSGAGTIVIAGDTESFSWAFSQPGRYYVLMESNGDLAPGSPSYVLTLSPGGGRGAGGGSPAPVVRSLRVPPRQHGMRVAVRIVLGQPVTRLRADLGIVTHGRSATIASRTLRGLQPGAHGITLGLPAAYIHQLARLHRLSLFVRVTLRAATGSRRMYTRPVRLTR